MCSKINTHVPCSSVEVLNVEGYLSGLILHSQGFQKKKKLPHKSQSSVRACSVEKHDSDRLSWFLTSWWVKVGIAIHSWSSMTFTPLSPSDIRRLSAAPLVNTVCHCEKMQHQTMKVAKQQLWVAAVMCCMHSIGTVCWELQKSRIVILSLF